MQKYKYSYYRMQLIGVAFALFDPFYDVLDKQDIHQLNYFFESFLDCLISMSLAIFVVTIIFNHFLKLEMFSPKGINIPKYKNKILAWENVKVDQSEINARFIDARFGIKIKSSEDSKFVHTLYISKFNEESLIKLTKENCPPDNGLYKIINKYCQKRKINFE